jgi:hypothetical protein
MVRLFGLLHRTCSFECFRDDAETLRAIMHDVGELARKYGALKLPLH